MTKSSSRNLNEPQGEVKIRFILVVRLKSLIYEVNQWITKQSNRNLDEAKNQLNSIPDNFATVLISLSPLPDKLTKITLSLLILGAF